MGKCISCGIETDDFRCCVRKDPNGSMHNDYQCEECTIKQVKKAQEEYKKKFTKKVLPYLLNHNFKVVATSTAEDSYKNIIEEFPVKDTDVMYCIDIIRQRMKDKGYREDWIDVHWEKYNGIEFEVVDYLSFEKHDMDNEYGISYTFELIGDNGLILKRTY